MTDTAQPAVGIDLGKYKLGWSDEEDYVFKPRKGLNEEIIREMSALKKEPQWMLDFRLRAYKIFQRKPMPNWGGDMSQIYFDDIYYYIKPTEGQVDAWEELPDSVKDTYEKLGIPEAERKYLAGVTAQYESEVVYHRNREDLEAQGVLFSDMDSAVKDYPELVQRYFGKIIPPGDNKFSALNSSAAWSGGSFIYVPPGRRGGDAAAGLLPDQRREHGPVRADADHRGRGRHGALHRGLLGAGVHVRLAALGRRRAGGAATGGAGDLHHHPELVRTTCSTWSPSVPPPGRLKATWSGSTATSAAATDDEVPGGRARRAPRPRARCCRWPTPGNGQHQDAGAKMAHAAPETTSKIVSKSISKDGGRTTYRGLVRVEEGMSGCRSHVQCDALLLDQDSRSDTYPYQEIGSRDAEIGHEATVSKVADEQLFYLMSRGLSAEQAMGMVVNGFIEPVTRTLPMEYAVEWSRLIELQMEGSIG